VKFSVGNSGLRPEYANNYDLLYEHFLKPIGMFQAGVFYKQLTAPQLTTIIPACVNLSALPAGTIDPLVMPLVLADETQVGVNCSGTGAYGSGATLTEFSTGENSTLYGIEISYQQHMTYLPSVLGGLGLTANYAYSNSRLKGNTLRTDHPRLLDEANNSWNLSPTYDTKRFSVRSGIEYNGSSIFAYGWVAPVINGVSTGSDVSGLGPKGPNGDTWMLPHLQIDAQASYRIYHGLSLQVSGLNLTNRVFGFYYGRPEFVEQREYYHPTYAFGLRYVLGK
jgi:outer membrane receptor protein involved in Fe transport